MCLYIKPTYLSFHLHQTNRERTAASKYLTGKKIYKHIFQMAAKQQAPANRVYEDIDPQVEWAREQDHDTLILALPGFKRDQLKVQVSSTRILRVNGERLVDHNKWRHFDKEFPIESNVDPDSITAKYEGGLLYIKHPKALTLTSRSRDEAKPTVEALKPQQKPKSDQPRPTQKSDQQPPAESPRPQQMPKSAQPRPTQKSAQEQAAQQVSSKSPNADKQTEGKATAQAQANAQKTSPTKKEKEGNEISEAKKDSRKTPVPETEKESPSEHANKKQSTSSPDSDNVSQKTGEKETIGSSEKAGKVAGASEEQKTLGDAEKKDKRPMTENDEQEGYAQWVYGLAMELKKPKKLMNLIVAALLVMVFVLYAKHAAKQPIKELESKLP